MSTDGLTIKERIALLKQSSPAASSNNEPSSASSRPKSVGYSLSKGLVNSTAESSLDERPKSLSHSKDKVTDRLESLKINASTPSSSSESYEIPKEKKSSSIADRIAALQNKSSENNNNDAQSPPVPKKLSVSFLAEASPDKSNEQENANIPSPPVKKLNTDRANFAKALNVGGFNPFAPRPAVSSPKETAVADSNSPKIVHVHLDAESNNGEIKHLALSRPSAPNTRRKQRSITKSTSEWSPDDVDIPTRDSEYAIPIENELVTNTDDKIDEVVSTQNRTA